MKCGPQGNMYILGPLAHLREWQPIWRDSGYAVDATGALVRTFPPQLPSGVAGPPRYIDFSSDRNGAFMGLISSLEETGGTTDKTERSLSREV